MKKSIAAALTAAVILTGCVPVVNGYADELTACAWKNEMSELYFYNGKAYLTIESAGECTVISGMYEAGDSDITIYTEKGSVTLSYRLTGKTVTLVCEGCETVLTKEG
ncbi:MAG: hypothetical protein IIZ59_00240 [Clostridia bacterium]|nr:hypothetical protein [Clostridia bacterium]